MTLAWPLKPRYAISTQNYTLSKHLLTFGSSINQWLKAVFIFWVNQVDKCGVDPSPGLNAVQATNDYVELHVKIVVLVLDLAIMGRDRASLHPLFHESRRTFRL
jgi:hypothetical protein